MKYAAFMLFGRRSLKNEAEAEKEEKKEAVPGNKESEQPAFSL